MQSTRSVLNVVAIIVHDLLALAGGLWTASIMFSGEVGWRDGPPTDWSFFLGVFVIPPAVGFALSFECMRGESIARELIGLFCVLVCGIFLFMSTIGLLQRGIYTFNWS